MMCGLPFSQREPRPTLVAAPLPSPAALRRQAGLLHRHRRSRARLAVPHARRHLRRRRRLHARRFDVGRRRACATTSQRTARRSGTRLYRAAVGGLINARGVIEALAAGTHRRRPARQLLATTCCEHNEPAFAAQVRIVASTDARPIPPLVATAPLAAPSSRGCARRLLGARHAAPSSPSRWSACCSPASPSPTRPTTTCSRRSPTRAARRLFEEL